MMVIQINERENLKVFHFTISFLVKVFLSLLFIISTDI